MGICQQKWLTTLSLGLVFSLSGVVSAKAATVSYEPVFSAGNDPGLDIAGLFGGGFATIGHQFSVNPDPTDVNFEMTAFGVFASPDNLFVPDNPDDYFILPEETFFPIPETVHEVALWEVDADGIPLSLDPIRRVTINPTIEDPDNPGTQIANPLLGFVDGFAYFSLDDPDDPVTPDNELDDIFTLSGSEQFFRLGVTYQDDSDQAWINDNSGGPLFGDVVIPNQNLDGVPNEGAAVDPMLELAPNIDGDDQPQGYYGIPTDPTTDELAFPDQEVLPFLGTNPFFVAGNVLLGPLPPSFPISATTTGGTTTGGTTTGGTTTGGTTTGGTTTGGTTTGGTTTGGTTTGGTTTGGTTTGGTPTIPEPSLINGLLAMVLGGITHSARQKVKSKR